MRKPGCCYGLILFMLLAQGASSDPAVDVATYEYPPYMSERLAGGGRLLSQVCAIAQRAGYRLRYHFMPFRRALLSTRNGEFDAMVSLFRTLEREAYFDYSPPIGKVRMSLIATDERKPELSSPLVVGIGRGYHFDAALFKPQWQVRQYDSDEAVFNMLRKNRVDMAYADPLVFEYLSHSKGEKIFYVTEDDSYSVTYDQHMVYPKNSDQRFRRDFNRSLAEGLNETGRKTSVCN